MPWHEKKRLELCAGKSENRLAPPQQSVYSAGMIRSTLLLLALVGGELAAAATASASVQTVAIEQQFVQALNNMIKTGSEDFYEAARIVADNGGSVSTFYDMMQKQAAAGNAAAIAWRVMYQLPYTSIGTPEYDRMLRDLDNAMRAKYTPAYILSATIRHETDNEKAKQHLIEACKSGNSKARALYILHTGRLALDKLNAPEVRSELNKKNHYLEELVANLQISDIKIVEWMKKACAHGSVTAPFILSQSPADVISDAERFGYLKTAVERHHVMAMYIYGSALINPDGYDPTHSLKIEKNEAAGRKMLELAAMLGSPQAAFDLAVYATDHKFGTCDAAEVYRLFDYAAQCGLPDGKVGKGYCLILGAGCEQDVQQGLRLLEAGRNMGNALAYQALASVYYNGFGGVKSDLKKASNYLMEAVAAGSPSAYTVMAAITALGSADTPPDATMADIYLQFAKDDLCAKMYQESHYTIYERVQKLYDDIVASRSWCVFPELVKQAQQMQ